MRLLLLVMVFCAAWPLLARAELDQVFFSDDFADGEHYFYEGELTGNQFSYLDGEYEIDTLSSGTYGQSILLEDLSTYRVEATGRLAETSDPNGAGFGLSLNYSKNGDDSNFLLFMVYDRGAYTLLRYSAGQTSQLQPPSRTRLFEPGENVTLMASLDAGKLTCYINGAEVAEVNEAELVSGGFGLFTAAGCVTRFEDFTVYADPPQPRGFSWDFSSETPLFTGEYENAQYLVQGDRYIINTKATQDIGLSPFPVELEDFELAFDIELLAGEPVGGYGIFVRDFSNPDGGFNQFRCLVSDDWFAVEQSSGQRPLALSEWRQHPAINSPGVNRIGVRAEGGELVFIINDVEVWRGQDENPQPGTLGFFVAGGLIVAFDNVELRGLNTR